MPNKAPLCLLFSLLLPACTTTIAETDDAMPEMTDASIEAMLPLEIGNVLVYDVVVRAPHSIHRELAVAEVLATDSVGDPTVWFRAPSMGDRLAVLHVGERSIIENGRARVDLDAADAHGVLVGGAMHIASLDDDALELASDTAWQRFEAGIGMVAYRDLDEGIALTLRAYRLHDGSTVREQGNVDALLEEAELEAEAE